MTILAESALLPSSALRRVTGADCYIPLADAANLILASEQELAAACLSAAAM